MDKDLTGEMEEPKGIKHDPGGFEIRAYTPKQQARLHVTDEGEPAEKEPSEDHGAEMPQGHDEGREEGKEEGKEDNVQGDQAGSAPERDKAADKGYRPPPTNPKFQGELCPWSRLRGDFEPASASSDSSPYGSPYGCEKRRMVMPANCGYRDFDLFEFKMLLRDRRIGFVGDSVAMNLHDYLYTTLMNKTGLP